MPYFKNLLILLFSIGSIALIRHTAHVGVDFEVFWRAAHFFINGESLYTLERDGGMIFKYPPWLIFFFAPLGFFSLATAKWIWGFVLFFSMLSILRWIVLRGCDLKLVLILWIFYWGLWVKHALTGQVALPMLATALWAYPHIKLERVNSRTFLLFSALSVKIFTLLPLFFRRPTRDFLKSLVGIALITFSLHVSVGLITKQNPLDLGRDWITASTSGGTHLTSNRVRSSDNAGLPGLVLRKFKISGESALPDILAFLGFGILIGGVWIFLTRNLPPRDGWKIWLGWLAILPVIHPLPWWHLFVFSFPAAAFALQGAWVSRKRIQFFGVCLGIFLVTMSSESILGSVGFFLREIAAKSWGSLILAYGVFSAPSGLLRERPLPSQSP